MAVWTRCNTAHITAFWKKRQSPRLPAAPRLPGKAVDEITVRGERVAALWPITARGALY
ncbi:MAG: hypothetical protein ACREVS_15020 [Burkholderiales bacterium]